MMARHLLASLLLWAVFSGCCGFSFHGSSQHDATGSEIEADRLQNTVFMSQGVDLTQSRSPRKVRALSVNGWDKATDGVISTDQDVIRWREFLTETYGSDVSFDSVSIAQGQESGVGSLFEKLIGMEKNENVLITLSSHGINDNAEHWGKQESDFVLGSRSITPRGFFEALHALDERRGGGISFLVIADFCFSGAWVHYLLKPEGEVPKSLIFMAASGSREPSADSTTGKGGVFTTRLINLFKNNPDSPFKEFPTLMGHALLKGSTDQVQRHFQRPAYGVTAEEIWDWTPRTFLDGSGGKLSGSGVKIGPFRLFGKEKKASSMETPSVRDLRALARKSQQSQQLRRQ